MDVSTKRTEPVPKEDWIVAKDALEPIISRKTFEAAYPVLKRYAKKRPLAKPKQLFRGTEQALNEQLAQMRQSDSDCRLVNDLGKYSFAGQLTRELLETLVKEIRVSGTDTMEIIFNFKE